MHGRSSVRRLLRQLNANAGLLVLGAVIGGGVFLLIDSYSPPDADRRFSLRKIYYHTCREALQDGRANIGRGEAGYRPELDADGDGLACEPYVPG